MKTRIGIIGVYDSIEVIKKISVEFKDITECIYCIYNELNEILEFIDESKEKVDVFMFTGLYAYNYIKKNVVLEKPCFPITKTNETLIETFWRMRSENIDYTRVSIDRSPKKEVSEILDLLSIPSDNIYVFPDSSKISIEEIYESHLNLWEKGKTSAIITSNYKLYKRFIKKDIPVYRILPSRYLIRDSIRKAIGIARTEKIKSTQVAIQTIRIRGINDDKILKYNQLKIINKFDDILIDYTQENQGSFFKFGSSEYMIFTTRGFLNTGSIEDKFGWLVERVEKLNLSFSLGIGYGDTVTKSENNSKTALNYALNESENCCYIIDDDSLITGPIYGNNSLNISYDLATVDDRIINISKQTGVSEKYLSKLKSIIKQTNNNIIDTEELAGFLGITTRSASRIINKLELGGIAKNIGKKSDKQKGRPKKIYEINLD